MNDTLFDLPEILAARTAPPGEYAMVRKTDPTSSHDAARLVAPGQSDLITAIRSSIEQAGNPLTQHQIAEAVFRESDGRWQLDTIRTACARSSLVAVGMVKTNGRSYMLWDLKEAAV